MIQIIANSITAACLIGVIICGLLTIRWGRQAAADWKRAKASWKEAETNWKRVEAANQRIADAQARIRAARRDGR
jgi:hypothetical protein